MNTFILLSCSEIKIGPRLDEWRARRDARTVPTVDGKGQVNYRAAMGDKIRTSGRDDWANYKPLLLRFLRLFGEGIHESLMRTCWDQLSHLSGAYSKAGADEGEGAGPSARERPR